MTLEDAIRSRLAVGCDNITITAEHTVTFENPIGEKETCSSIEQFIKYVELADRKEKKHQEALAKNKEDEEEEEEEADEDDGSDLLGDWSYDKI